MKTLTLMIGLALVVALMITGCATSNDRAIESGAKWGAVGAATGALVGVAGNTHVGRAAAIGTLLFGLPAMAAEMLKPEPPSAPVAAVPPAVVYLPAPREVYISAGPREVWLEPEVKWVIVRELRTLGYQVNEKYSAPLQLRIELTEAQDPKYPKYICVAYLVDQASGRVLAQGRAEARLNLVTKEGRVEAKKQAAIAAIRSLN